MKLLTNLVFNPKGPHNPAQAYNVKDTVMSADGSRVYFALQDVPPGIQLDNVEYWICQIDLSKTKSDMDAAIDTANAIAANVKTDIAQLSEEIATVGNATTEDKSSENKIGYTEELAYVLGKTDANPTSMGTQTHYVVSSQITVIPGETVFITASSLYGYVIYAFYDVNGAVVYKYNAENVSTYTELIDYETVVPQNAATLRIAYNSNITSYPGVKRLANTVIPKRKWLGKKWACVGDSLTESNSRTEKNYHDYLAEATGITVVNMGVSGSGYARKSESNNAFYQRISSVPADADVVTIFGSGNDMGAGLELGTSSDTGTTTLCGCINTTIDNLIALMPTVSLGIVSPTPWISYPPSNTENAMAKYSEALKTICEYRSIPFLDLYHCSNLRPWTEEGRAACYTKDDGNGVHPDETGHKLIAARFNVFLETLIM